MKFTRVLSHGLCPVEQQVTWKKVDVQVEDMRTGAAIFEQADVEVPKQWSDHAASILSQKYFRKVGVPARAQYHQPHPHDPLMPKWLHPSLPADGCSTGGETSARQVFHRLAGAWTYHGWLSGIFYKRDRDQAGGTILGTVQEADENARIFYDELYLCLAHQIAAPNSPQWFNTGLWWAYGIEGNDSGMWVCDDGKPRRINTSYMRPQPHACFLTSVEDDLVNPGGIMDAWVREARIFKHGSGSGMNVSGLRAKGELLAGGGKSSGVMSWLRIGDSAAGAIQSGGTTRRAAVMRIMDVDHPEIEEFICFTGDTAVWTLLGPRRFDELAESGVTVPVLTELDDGKLVYRDMVSPRMTRGKFAPLVEVKLKSRLAKTVTSVRCTPDHVFFLRNGDRKCAADLCAGDRIRSAYRYVYDDDYVGLYGSSGGKCREHVLVAEYKYGKFPARTECVHHIDGDRQNNRPENIVVLPRSVHVSDHLSAPESIAKRSATVTGKKRSVETRRAISNGRKRWFDQLPDDEKDLIRKNASEHIVEGRRRWFDSLSDEERATERQRLRTLRNHVVVSVTKLVQSEPVYCGTVPSTGKFFVLLGDKHKEGVLVSNCWKVREESKAAAMHVGSRMLRECEEDLPEHFVPQQVRDRLENGFEQEVFGIGWEEEANRTIDGQNSNNSVRVTEHFMRKASRRDEDADWSLTARTTGATMKVIDARDLWDTICRAAWASADPGLLFHDTINAWNTSAADGVIRTTNPCAEFHHLDGSACNLASMRLTAFLRDDSSLDLTLFQHVCRLFTVVLDVSVSMASFPAEEFALGAWRYRTLGLGYADLGALLMRMAFPYDSTPGRALAAALTSLMTGVAYKTSAEMAAEIGPFPRWEANAVPMRRVLRNHARTAGLTKERIKGAEHDEYEGLNYFPAQINHMVSKELNSAIQHVWVDVCSAESFRNAQVTLLAPTGTISFVMDCDTTGVESDLGLVKYKNLAGGGSMKIVNQSVACSLTTQGFSSALITEIVRYVEEYGTVEDCPAIPVELRSRAYAVFECSNPAPGFSRCLRWEAHVEMLAAVQPHLSGAASKTINMPATATVEDVSAAYMMAWKLGVKAVALYRDGCKLSQPLQTTPITAKRDVPVVQLAERAAHNGVVAGSSPAGHTTSRGAKEHLPWRRDHGYTQKAKIGDQTLFWRVSEYPDGRPGEIFIELAHEGSTMRAIANSVAIAMSVALQHGTPITELVDKFLYVKFEPAGYVEGHPHVKFATSIFDLIAKDLAITYLGRDDLKAEQSHVAIDGPEKVVALDRRALAAAGGSLTGDPCPACGGLLRRTGTCRTCTNCAWNEGCG